VVNELNSNLSIVKDQVKELATENKLEHESLLSKLNLLNQK
jgi:hypothetical protein